MRKLNFQWLGSGLILIMLAGNAGAQAGMDQTAANWNGTWIAQGTLFSVAVTIEDDNFLVDEIQSLGFVWSSQPGKVNGDQATVEVQYLGVTALLLARLTGDGIAVVEAASCIPEFIVVCALAKGQQATFVRETLD